MDGGGDLPPGPPAGAGAEYGTAGGPPLPGPEDFLRAIAFASSPIIPPPPPPLVGAGAGAE